jgi:hypothetical protein
MPTARKIRPTSAKTPRTKRTVLICVLLCVVPAIFSAGLALLLSKVPRFHGSIHPNFGIPVKWRYPGVRARKFAVVA